MKCGRCGETYKATPLVAETSKDEHDSNLPPPAKKRRELLDDGSSGSDGKVGKCYYVTALVSYSHCLFLLLNQMVLFI